MPIHAVFFYTVRIGRPKLLILLFALGGMGQALADERPAMSIARAARPEVVRGNERRLLDQLQRFLDARQWDDAWSLVARLVEADSTSVVPIDESLYVALPAYCHRLLSHLPPAALARYRELVDPTAEAWYRQGVATATPGCCVVWSMKCSAAVGATTPCWPWANWR